MGSSRYKSSYDFENGNVKLLKLNSHNITYNAYKYWLIWNSTHALDAPSKLDKPIELLVEDSPDFHQQAQALLD